MSFIKQSSARPVSIGCHWRAALMRQFEAIKCVSLVTVENNVIAYVYGRCAIRSQREAWSAVTDIFSFDRSYHHASNHSLEVRSKHEVEFGDRARRLDNCLAFPSRQDASIIWSSDAREISYDEMLIEMTSS